LLKHADKAMYFAKNRDYRRQLSIGPID